jgi:hypothetical protein
MKFKFLFSIMVFLFISSFDFVIVKYESKVEKAKYEIEIPSNYVNYFFITGGEAESEYVYFYKDSSCIYITDNIIPFVNCNNIDRLGDSISNFRFQNNELKEELNKTLGKEIFKLWPDTLELFGKDENFLYWKDIKIGNISIGYGRVPKENKKTFDESLKTLKKLE